MLLVHLSVNLQFLLETFGLNWTLSKLDWICLKDLDRGFVTEAVSRRIRDI